jgi:hypothetical protein
LVKFTKDDTPILSADVFFNEKCVIDDSRRLAMDMLREKSIFDDKTIKEGMKRIGIKYDKDLSGLGKNILNKPYKGGFNGCYYKENKENNENNENNEKIETNE